MSTGKPAGDGVPFVYLVGAGPGEPDLITVRGKQVLEQADIVIYDYLADARLLEGVPSEAERVYVGKKAGQHTLKQEQINALIVDKARGGKKVVRLKGGDPFVFGRGGEECEELRAAGIPYEVVPGVTSGVAAPAYAGIPVTHRGVASSVAFITGHEDPSRASSAIAWEYLAKGVDTLVFYMGVGNLPNITRELIAAGRPASTPVALIRWGTKPSQQTVVGTLETIVNIAEREGIGPPAITIVGDVVRLRDRLTWFEGKPLFGRKIINTRSRRQASAFTRELRARGADVVELPTIETVFEPAGGALDKEVGRLDRYDWVVFTSPNGAEAFFERVLAVQGDVRALGACKIASIGPATSAVVERYRVRADVTARESVAEGLVNELSAVGPWKGRRVLLPRAEKARDVLPDALRGDGAEVKVVTAYRTERPANTEPEVVADIVNGRYDLITFSSSSTFTNLAELLGPDDFGRAKQHLRAASIGPITSSAIRDKGIEPVVEAREHTIAGLVRAIEEHFTS